MAPIVNVNSANNYPSSYSLEVERKLWDSYTPNFHLGEGSYGYVMAASRTSDMLPVAIKVMKAEKVKFTSATYEGVQRRYPKEVLALDTARFLEGVVNLLQWCDCGDKIIIVMERPRHSIDLKDYLDTRGILNEANARTVMTQVVKTTHDLMNLGILHRDLKAENILVDLHTFAIKLVDFGLIAQVSSPNMFITNKIGTASHFPPELLTCNQFRADAGNVWVMGIILHELLLGYVPFQDEAEILRGHFYSPPHISLAGQDFLQLCLKTNPNQRPSLSQLMSHSWINPHIQSPIIDSNATATSASASPFTTTTTTTTTTNMQIANPWNPQYSDYLYPSQIDAQFAKLF